MYPSLSQAIRLIDNDTLEPQCQCDAFTSIDHACWETQAMKNNITPTALEHLQQTTGAPYDHQVNSRVICSKRDFDTLLAAYCCC